MVTRSQLQRKTKAQLKAWYLRLRKPEGTPGKDFWVPQEKWQLVDWLARHYQMRKKLSTQLEFNFNPFNRGGSL